MATLDCDSYDCPMYDGRHGCKKEIVSIQGGICQEYFLLKDAKAKDDKLKSDLEKLLADSPTYFTI